MADIINQEDEKRKRFLLVYKRKPQVQYPTLTYTSTDGNIVSPYSTSALNVNIISNTYNDGVGTIKFDGELTNVGEKAFYNCRTLKSIILPDTVTTIDKTAFNGCSGLVEVNIPSSVSDIYVADFMSQKTSVFGSCSNLEVIVVDENNSNYDSRNNCNAIIETSTNTLIAGCKETTIPEDVTTIGAEAFYGNKNIETLTMPQSVKYIKEQAFDGCTNLNNIDQMGDGLENMEYRAFANTGIGTFLFGNKLKDIGQSAFENTPITQVNIGESLEVIGTEAFYNCKNLSEIVIDPSKTVLSVIGNSAFYGCSKLTGVTISDSVTEIYNLAFGNCSELQEVDCYANIPPEAPQDIFYKCPKLKKITVNPKPLGEYWTVDGWKAYKSIIRPANYIEYNTNNNAKLEVSLNNFGTNTTGETNVYDTEMDLGIIGFSGVPTEIGSEEFKLKTPLQTIKLPEGITSIGISAFEGCKYLSDVNLPDSLVTIDSKAFSGCEGLVEVNIPDNVVSIGFKAFDGCTNLDILSIGSSVSNISTPAFGFCNSLTLITVASDNTKYDERNGCSAIIETATNKLIAGCKDTVIPEDVTSIGDSAFIGCTQLKSINLPSSVTKIGSSSFANCDGITGLTIPTTITNIGDLAFGYCTGLISVNVLAETPPTAGNYIFDGCDNLTEIIVPDNALETYWNADGWKKYKSIIRTKNYVEYTTTDGTTINVSKKPSNVNILTNIYDTEQGCGVMVFDKGLQMTPDRMFAEQERLISIKLHIEGLKTIYTNAFAYCKKLTTISMPNTVTFIGDSAFISCESIKTFVIPDSVTNIGMKVFADCTGLTSITISENIGNDSGGIGDYALSGCTSLETIIVKQKTPFVISKTTISDCDNLTAIKVPAESVETYKTTDGWKDYKELIVAI